jgi:hypothetical protein
VRIIGVDRGLVIEGLLRQSAEWSVIDDEGSEPLPPPSMRTYFLVKCRLLRRRLSRFVVKITPKGRKTAEVGSLGRYDRSRVSRIEVALPAKHRRPYALVVEQRDRRP